MLFELYMVNTDTWCNLHWVEWVLGMFFDFFLPNLLLLEVSSFPDLDVILILATILAMPAWLD